MNRPPRVAALGLAAWDRLMIVDRYPSLSEQATVREEIEAPGGTTANSAAALARLGARVRLAAAIGDDATGRALRQAL
ncbi:MAG: hypothetical protein IT337_10085, partial [Thermomicrobiales bacterium]|nr:hypothetical protein [Thermomicrobiales bacterium]